MDNNRQHGSPIEYHERCPRCGSTLITNGRAAWCTLVGDRSHPGCGFRATLTMEPETKPEIVNISIRIDPSDWPENLGEIIHESVKRVRDNELERVFRYGK